MMFSILNMEFSDRVKERMKELKLSAVELAASVGVSKGAVSHWTSGSNLATGQKLVALAKALRCNENWLMTGKGTPDQEHADPSFDSDYALINQLSAKGSSGNGYINDHVEVVGGLAFKRDWLRRMGLKPEKLCVAYNHGESNWPTLTDGDVVLIDISSKSPTSGSMFAMHDADQEVIFKRLIREISGGWIIRSDNQDKTRYPDMPISAEGMRGVDIIGKIVWRGGAM